MKVHFSHDSKNVDRQRLGAQGVFHVQRCWGWLGDCQKTHKRMCPQGHRSTEHTHTIWPFIALSSVSSRTCCQWGQRGQALNPHHQLCDLEWGLQLPGLSFPMCEEGTELVSTSQSHFENTVRLWLWQHLKEAGIHSRFSPGSLYPSAFLVHVQRLNLTSCHCSYHMEGCCAPLCRQAPSFFSKPTFYLLASSVILYSPCPHDGLLLFLTMASIVNQSQLSSTLASATIFDIIFQSTCVNWSELARSLSLCVPFPPSTTLPRHEQFPRIKIEWMKPECGWSSGAVPYHKCSPWVTEKEMKNCPQYLTQH